MATALAIIQPVSFNLFNVSAGKDSALSQQPPSRIRYRLSSRRWLNLDSTSASHRYFFYLVIYLFLKWYLWSCLVADKMWRIGREKLEIHVLLYCVCFIAAKRSIRFLDTMNLLKFELKRFHFFFKTSYNLTIVCLQQFRCCWKCIE